MKVKISVVVLFVTLFAASLVFADGYNLVGWPLEVDDTSVQAVMADSMGSGCQLTGGFPGTGSDQVKYYDPATTTWYTAWYKQGGPSERVAGRPYHHRAGQRLLDHHQGHPSRGDPDHDRLGQHRCTVHSHRGRPVE
jgi:hypothetical protein